MHSRAEPSVTLIVGQFVVLALLLGVAVVNYLKLQQRSEWMNALRDYSEARSADRATRTAVQEAFDTFARSNGLQEVEVKVYEPKIKFPEPPK